MKMKCRLIMALTLIVSMISTSFAQERISLKSTVDEYVYALTVEWDQKGLDFLHAQDELLQARLESIADKITDEEIAELFPGIDFTHYPSLSRISNADQLREYIARNPVQYTQGAKWEGVIIGGLAAGFIVVFLYHVVKNGFRYDRATRSECEMSGGYWSIWGCNH